MKKKIYFLCFMFFLALKTDAKQPEKFKIWSDKDYQLQYPASWILIKSTNKKNCIFLNVKLFQPIGSSKNENDFKICKYHENFISASERTSFFQQDQKWIAAGSMDQQPAQFTLRNGIVTIETITLPTCGIFDKNDVFHAAGGECYTALVSNNTISIILESNGANNHQTSMRNITKSVVLKLN